MRALTLLSVVYAASACNGSGPTGQSKHGIVIKVKVAAIQYGPSDASVKQVDLACTSRSDPNTCAVERLVEQSAAAGAEIVVAPELVLDQQYYEPDPKAGDLPADNGALSEQSLLKIFSRKAKELGILLVVHFQTQDARTQQKFSTQVVYDKTGMVLGAHHKFELYGRENASLVRGADLTIVDTPLGKAAPLICADLYGDPRHHAKLVDSLNAQVILVSSYWTVPSGARWQAAFAKNWGVHVIGSNVTTGPGRGGGIYGPDGLALAEHLDATPKVLFANITVGGS